jgi:hypothetical protein
MTTIVEINTSNPLAGPLLEYLASLPYATLKGNTGQSFSEAARECNAVPVSVFTAELHRQIDEYFDRQENA